MAFLQQLKAFWDNISKTRRLWMSAGAAVVVLGAVVSYAIMSFVPMGRLMYLPDTESAAEVVQFLEENNVPYALRSNGREIVVPQKSVDRLRLQIASEGIPNGGSVGYEILDSMSSTMSRSTEDKQHKRALEGELSRTIRSLRAIQEARVHIVVPEKTIFLRQNKAASASVTVKTFRSQELSDGQINAIVSLVASSVPGLNREEVTVVDARGQLLSRDSSSGLSQDRIKYENTLEKNLERRALEILEPAVGVGRAVVKVNVDLDVSSTEVTEETYDPDSIALRNENTLKEEKGNASNKVGGIPGAAGNLEVGESSSSSGANMSKAKETRNYEINKKVKHHVSAAGEVRRMTVALLVDHVDKDGKTVAMSTAELSQLESLVKNALGFSEKRGDVLTVDTFRFTDNEITEIEPTRDLENQPWLIYAGGVAGIVLILAILIFRFLRARRSAAIPLLEGPTSVSDYESYAAGELSGDGAPIIPIDRSSLAQLEESVEPRNAAFILSNWIAEERAS